MPHLFLILSQSDYLIQIIDINSHTSWQIEQIQISWLLQKPTDLDLHCLQRQGISGLSRTRVNIEHLSVIHPSILSFLNDKLNKCQWIFNKIGMCIDIVKIWIGIANGQILSIFDSCLPASHDSDGVLSVHFFSSRELCWGWAIVVTFCPSSIHSCIRVSVC